MSKMMSNILVPVRLINYYNNKQYKDIDLYKDDLQVLLACEYLCYEKDTYRIETSTFEHNITGNHKVDIIVNNSKQDWEFGVLK